MNVGREVHLDLDEAGALARLAAPALDVEREPSGRSRARCALFTCANSSRIGVNNPATRRRIERGFVIGLW
jgi:hypothetical protein